MDVVMCSIEKKLEFWYLLQLKFAKNVFMMRTTYTTYSKNKSYNFTANLLAAKPIFHKESTALPLLLTPHHINQEAKIRCIPSIYLPQYT